MYQERIYCIFIIVIFYTEDSKGELNYFLNSFEFGKSFEVMKSLEIRHQIFVRDLDQKEINLRSLKNFSNNLITSTALSHKQLIEYFENGSFPNVNSIIILKEANLLTIVKMFEDFKSVVNKAHRFTWLVFVEIYDLAESKKLNVPYNCRFLIAYSLKENFKLIEVYKVKSESFLSEIEIFNDKNLKITNDFLYLKRMNLNGSEIVMNFDDDSFENNQHLISSRQLEILDDIAKIMNFQFSYRKLGEVDYTDIEIDGDLYDTPFPFYPDYFMTNFLGPMFKTVINWNIKYPEVRNEGNYIKPFELNLWFCIISYIAFNSVVLILMKKIVKEKVSNVEVAFIGLDSLCCQYGNRDSEKNYLRIVIFALQMMAIIIVSAYNAVIISYLAIRKVEIPFRNLEEFKNDGSYLIAFPAQSFVENYFKDSPDRLLNRIYNNLSLTFNSDTLAETLQRFCGGELVLTSFDSDILFDLKCNVLQIETPITFTLVGIVLKKHSPFKDVWNYILIRFYTSGIQKILQKKTQEHSYINPIEDTLDPVEINQMDQLLVVLGIGFILSGIIFLIEIFCRKCFALKSK